MATLASMFTVSLVSVFPRAYVIAFERWAWTAYILFVLHAVAHLRWPVTS